MQDLTGKLAWVTGAGTGIGAAGAEKLAGAGCKVILSGRRREPLEETAARIRNAGGEVVDIVTLDVSDRDAVAEVGEKIIAEHGAVDILVNNAGINVPKRHWRDVSQDDWDAMMKINVNGVFYCTQAVLPAMRAQKSGTIINISSWAGVRVSYLTGPGYTAAKHAVSAMTENLNMEECVNGIRATAICPGEVSTPIMDKRPVPMSAEDRARMTQPDEMGETILFCAALPQRTVINELVIGPVWNRGYVANHQRSGPE